MSDLDALWEAEDPIADMDGFNVPRWIEQDISPSQVADILQGGCASGAYMPAATYYDARETMNKHGDDVLQYIEDVYGTVQAVFGLEYSWSSMACSHLSMAVELWAGSVEDELRTALEEKESES